MVPMSGPRWGEAGTVGKRDRTQDRLFAAGLGSAAVGAGGVALNRHAARVMAEAPLNDTSRVVGWAARVKNHTAERKAHAGAVARAHEEAAGAQRELGIINTATAGRSGLSSVVIKPHGAKAAREYPLNAPEVHERVRYLEREKIPALSARHQEASAAEAKAKADQAAARAALREAKANPTAPKVIARWKPRGRLGTGLAVAGGVGALGSMGAIERHRSKAVAPNAAGRRIESKPHATAAPTADAAKKRELARSVSGGVDLKWNQKQIGEWGP